MTNFKTFLLAGTAVVAIGAAPAFATDVDLNAATGTWSSAATQADDGTVEEALAGENLNASVDSVLTITNDGTADDGSVDTNTFALGDVTDSDGTTLDVVVTDGAGAATLNVTINSLAIDGGITVTSNGEDINLGITEDSTLGGGLTIGDGAGAGIITTTAAGLTVVGATAIDATGADASLTVSGSSDFQGGVTLTDGGNAALLAVNVATDGADLTIAGDIIGGAAGEGTVSVDDADATTEDLVTFTGSLGAAGAELLAVTVGTGATGGGAQFDGDVLATDVTVGDTGNTGNVFADFNGDITGDLTITSSTGTADQTTSVNIGGDVTGAIVLADPDDAFGSADILFDGTEAQTVTGDIDGAGAGEGTVVFGSGSSVTVDGVGETTEIAQFTIEDGATVNLTDASDIQVNSAAAGSINIDGTLNVDTTSGTTIDDTGTGIMALDGTVVATGGGTLTLGSGGTIHAGWNDTEASLTTDGVVDVTDAFIVGDDAGDMYTIYASAVGASVDGGGASDLQVADGATLNLGLSETNSFELDGTETVQFLDNFATVGDDVQTLYDDGAITFGNFLITGTVTADADGLEVANLDNVDATTLAGISTATAGTINALLGLTVAESQAGTGELETLRNSIVGAPTTADANTLAEGYSPNVDGGAQLGVLGAVTNTSLGITGERLASLRSGDASTGMAAGNMTHGLKTWARVFGTTGEQDERDNITGYDVDTYGVSVGIDTQTLAEDWVWGLAFTYGDTEIDKTVSATAGTDVDIDTYQFSVYADYKWDAATYINGQIGYGMNSGDQTRTFAGLVANADVDSDVFFARLETGRDYDMDNGWTLTPIALLNYQHINADGYTETGTCGAACLTVDTDNLNILEAGLAGEASYLHQNSDGSFFKPKLHAAYRYDFIGDEVEATSSFAGAPTVAFNTEGFDAQQNTFNVGAGLEFYTTSNWEMSVNYDYEIKEDYDGHNGYVRAAYKF